MKKIGYKTLSPDSHEISETKLLKSFAVDSHCNVSANARSVRPIGNSNVVCIVKGLLS